MRETNDEIVPFREVGKAMGIGAATVWDILDKIKMRFERNKKLMHYFQEGGFDLENINL